MGPKKKRSHPSHSKPPSSTPKNPTTSDVSPPPEEITTEQLENAVIQSSCDQALAAFHNGNLTEALKLINDASYQHENSAIVHHTLAFIHSIIASQVEDKARYQEHLKNAVESAKKAISLSPNCIEYLLTHVNSLFQLSGSSQDYEEVMKECDLALSMIETSSQEKCFEHAKREFIIISGKAKIGSAMILRRGSNAASTSEEGPEVPDEEDQILTNKEERKSKLEERKRIADAKKKGIGISIDEVMEFWKCIKVEERRGLLRTSISEFKEYCGELIKAGVLGTDDWLVSGAIDYAYKARTWKYWGCCICGKVCVEKFVFTDHITRKHLRGIPAELARDILPQEIDAHNVEMLLNGFCKPLDTAEAVRIMGDESKDPKNYQDWPFSDDLERASILETIYGKFQLLLPHNKWIAVTHLRILMNCTRGILLNEGIVSKSQIRIHGLDQTPVCIRLLGASELRLVLHLLQQLHSEISTIANDFNVDNEYEAKERIGLFSDGTLCLFWEESLQCGEEIKSPPYLDSTADDASAKTSAVSDDEVDGMAERDEVVSRLFIDFTIEATLVLWQHLQIVKHLRGMELHMNLMGNLSEIENMFRRKYDYLIREKSLQSIQRIYTEEIVKRNQGTSYTPQNFKCLLKKRQEELVGRNDGSDSAELYGIGRIIEADAAEAMKVYEEDADQGDNKIRIYIENLLKVASLEISKIEAKILKTFSCIQHLFFQLTKVAVHDYRLIIAPILQSFMRAKLEDRVYKYATEKANAASEALLAELESDADKNVNKGCDQMKKDGKSIDKKKKRSYYRKPQETKQTKATGVEQKQLEQETDKEQDDSEMLRLEEELRHKLEIEVNARLLEEYLEFQRQIENAGTQKQPADLNEMADGTVPEVAETSVSATGELQEGNDLDASSTDVTVENMDGPYIFFGSHRCSLTDATGENMDNSNN